MKSDMLVCGQNWRRVCVCEKEREREMRKMREKVRESGVKNVGEFQFSKNILMLIIKGN